MDPRAALAAFDDQLRRNPPADPGATLERDGDVLRQVGAEGWCGVLWSDLDAGTADAAIARQMARFAGRDWEWKHYSYDRPADLPERLRAAGLSPEPAEALLVAEAADVPAADPPDGVTLVPVADEAGLAALVGVHERVFGGDHAAFGRALRARFAAAPESMAAVLAVAGGQAVSAARIEFETGTDFAGLWGGGTVPEWRGRGVFRALVAYRAALATARGYRYLRVDAMPASEPILRRLGFERLATTTPYTYPPGVWSAA